jgi:spore maturation protein CgeB
MSFLKSNFACLSESHSALLTQLAEIELLTTQLAKNNAVATCQIDIDGELRWLHSAYDPVFEAQQWCDQLDGKPDNVVLMGGGLGYQLALLFERFPSIKVTLVEPYLACLVSLLDLFDFSEQIKSGQLHLLTANVDDVLDDPQSLVLWHPVLKSMYQDVYWQLRFQTVHKDKSQSVLLLDYKLFVNDIRPLLEKNNYAVRQVSPQTLNINRFKQLVTDVQPAFVFSINFSPEIALLCSLQNVVYISWTIDPLPVSRLKILQGTNISLCLCCVHQQKLLKKFQKLGLKNSHFLPLAAGKRTAVSAQQPLHEVSFVGSSLSSEQKMLQSHLPDGAVQDRLQQWIQQLFQQHGDDNHFFGVQVADLPDWLQILTIENDVLVDLINGELSRLLRQYRLQAESQIKVYGDTAWQSLGENYLGYAQHGSQLSNIYANSLINIDIPRLYQRDIITMRVFDVLLCGGFLLTEKNSAISKIFKDGFHLVMYRDTEHMLKLIESFRKNSKKCKKIAQAGQRLVQQRHQMTHRITTLLKLYAKMAPLKN